MGGGELFGADCPFARGADADNKTEARITRPFDRREWTLIAPLLRWSYGQEHRGPACRIFYHRTIGNVPKVQLYWVMPRNADVCQLFVIHGQPRLESGIYRKVMLRARILRHIIRCCECLLYTRHTKPNGDRLDTCSLLARFHPSAWTGVDSETMPGAE